MWGQTFEFADLGVVAFLILLEGLLSADNALVLAIMVRHLPKDLRQKALLYGLGGALVFRLIAILLAQTILSLWWLQVVGAVYLLYLPLKHFIGRGGGHHAHETGKGFWQTVVAVEVADIAFAIDSVLAAVALVSQQSKVWVVYLGAMMGVVLLRFAAGLFVRLLERYPVLDHVAFVLVGWVGVKLGFMAGHSYGEWFEKANPGQTTFHIPTLPAVVFWTVLAVIAIGGTWIAMRNPAGKLAEKEGEQLAEQYEEVEEALEMSPETPDIEEGMPTDRP